MSHLRLIPLSLAALTAAACASTPAPMDLTPADAGAPQPLAGHDWFLDDGDTFLVYGRDETDDVWLSFSCLPGSGTVDIAQYSAPEGADRIALESGGDTETWPASPEPDDLNDGVYLTAQASAREPVFLRFRSVGWLASWGTDGRVMMAAHPGSAPRIERFFAACG